MRYIDEHRDEFGVEPICAVLKDAGVKIAPSTYYAVKTRPPSARSVTDVKVLEKVRKVHAAKNEGTYGAEKVWAQVAAKAAWPGPGWRGAPWSG